VVNIVWNCFFLFVRRLADCLTFCSYVYEASSVVTGVISYLEEQRNSLIDLQERHGVKVWHIGGFPPFIIQSIVALVTDTPSDFHFLQQNSFYCSYLFLCT
jgi:hypothetical protein